MKPLIELAERPEELSLENISIMKSINTPPIVSDIFK
jgi:hypothetical protein